MHDSNPPPLPAVTSALVEYRVTKLEEAVHEMETHIQQKLDNVNDSLAEIKMAAITQKSTTWQNVVWGPLVASVMSGLLLWFILRVVDPAIPH